MTQEEVLALFDEYHQDIYRMALSYTGSRHDAEDVTQNTFIRLLERHPPLEKGKEKAWLMQVAVNLSKDLLKSFWRSKTAPMEVLPEVPFDSAEQSELFAAVMTLPPKERIVLHLYYYEGYSQQEIGELLKLNQSAVSMRLYRAKKRLKSFLEEENL